MRDFPHSLQRYAELHDMEFMETSAKMNKNVREAFTRLASEICELRAQQAPLSSGGDTGPNMSLARNTKPLREEGGSCYC